MKRASTDTSTKRQDGIIEYIQFQAFEKGSREGQILIYVAPKHSIHKYYIWSITNKIKFERIHGMYDSSQRKGKPKVKIKDEVSRA